MKNSKKAELYKDMMEAKLSVQYRLYSLFFSDYINNSRIKVMKNEGLKTLPSENADSLKAKVKDDDEVSSNTERYSIFSQVKGSIRNKLDNVGSEEADLIFFIPEGVQLFTIEVYRFRANYPFRVPKQQPQLIPHHFKFCNSVGMQKLKLTLKNNRQHLSRYRILRFAHIFARLARGFIHCSKNRLLSSEMNLEGTLCIILPLNILVRDFNIMLSMKMSPDMMVAILLPSDVEPRIHEEFQQILQEHAVLKEQDTTKELTPEENSRLGKKIAEFLIIGMLTSSYYIRIRWRKGCMGCTDSYGQSIE